MLQAVTAGSDSPAHKLRALIDSGWMTQALRVAAELGIADRLAEGPASLEQLAQYCAVDDRRLLRLLRALCSLDICREPSDRVFESTQMGALLARDAPESLHNWAKWFGTSVWDAWGQLLYSVQTGNSARTRQLGTQGFEHLERSEQMASTFHRAMVELTRLVARDVVESIDFSGFHRVVDVGGGHGELVAAALERHPHLSGVVFDQAHALQGAREHLQARGLSSRCELREGDFFTALPEDGDAYLLKSILHDWNDADSARILACCRRALRKSVAGVGGAHLMIVEHLLPVRVEASADHRALTASDLQMLVALGAGERSEAQYRDLLVPAGFDVVRVIPTGCSFSVIDATLAG